MLSPIILIASLFAPTVPSPPSPQNLHWTSPSGVASISSSIDNDVFVTSSIIPTVKLFLGSFDLRLSKTALTIDGVKSFEPRPYLPPTIVISFF